MLSVPSLLDSTRVPCNIYCQAEQRLLQRLHRPPASGSVQPAWTTDSCRARTVAWTPDLSLRSLSGASESAIIPEHPAHSRETDERLPLWTRLWRQLSAVVIALLATLKGRLRSLTSPKAASVAEARQEAQKRVLGQKQLGSPNKHGKEYKMALARTRQAVSIQKALQYQRLANPARAKVELQRALSENAVCRAPLLAARYSKQQMQGLYKLYLETTELPPNYAHLLQLQDMLDLDKRDAEELEADIMENAAAFSI